MTNAQPQAFLAAAPSVHGLRRAGRQVALAVLLVALPLTLNVGIYWYAIQGGYGTLFGFDFHAVWQAGRDVVAGHSPYPPPVADALAGEDQFVYPAAAAVAAVPLSILPFPVAATIVALLLAALVPLTLCVLGVRDWRCYGAAFLWLPVVEDVKLGAISIALAFAVAVAWRFRSRPWLPAVAVAGVITTKVFLWPLLVWLVATRRYATAARAAALIAAASIGAWALIGFEGLSDYPRLLGELSDLLAAKSFSVAALGMSAGLSNAEAIGLSSTVALLLVAVAVVAGRSGSRETAVLAAALGASFAFSPIVWPHYLVLLLVPIAIARPRWSPLWALPLAMWVSSAQSGGEAWRIAVGVAVTAGVLAISGAGHVSWQTRRTRGWAKGIGPTSLSRVTPTSGTP